jgi:hypothetical protein
MRRFVLSIDLLCLGMLSQGATFQRVLSRALTNWRGRKLEVLIVKRLSAKLRKH